MRSKSNNKLWVLGLLSLSFLTLVLYSCSKADAAQPEEQATPSPPFVLTQESLDAAIFISEARDTLITGDPFNAREIAARNNFRSIFSTSTKNQVLRPGHITAIRNFSNVNGQRGQLLFVDVMVKREAGFNTAGNDFEYMRIAFDPSVNYEEHPNGLVPDSTNSGVRGLGTNILTVNCVDCHKNTSGFIFYDN